MTCLAEIQGNQNCANCILKNKIHQDRQGGEYLLKRQLPNGVTITTQPRDGWAGIPSRQVVRCNRDLGIPVV